MKKANKSTILKGVLSATTIAAPVALLTSLSCGTSNAIVTSNELKNYVERSVAKSIQTTTKRSYSVFAGNREVEFNSMAEAYNFISNLNIQRKNYYKLPTFATFPGSTETDNQNVILENNNSLVKVFKKANGTYTFAGVNDLVAIEKARAEAATSYIQVHNGYQYRDYFFDNFNDVESYVRSLSEKEFQDLIENRDSGNKMIRFQNGVVKTFSSINEIKHTIAQAAVPYYKDDFGNLIPINQANLYKIASAINGDDLNYIPISSNDGKGTQVVDMDASTPNGQIYGPYLFQSGIGMEGVYDPLNWKPLAANTGVNSYQETYQESILNAYVSNLILKMGTRFDDFIKLQSLIINNQTYTLEQYLESISNKVNYRTLLDNFFTEIKKGARYSALGSLILSRAFLMDKMVQNQENTDKIINVSKFYHEMAKLLDVLHTNEIAPFLVGKPELNGDGSVKNQSITLSYFSKNLAFDTPSDNNNYAFQTDPGYYYRKLIGLDDHFLGNNPQNVAMFNLISATFGTLHLMKSHVDKMEEDFKVDINRLKDNLKNSKSLIPSAENHDRFKLKLTHVPSETIFKGETLADFDSAEYKLIWSTLSDSIFKQPVQFESNDETNKQVIIKTLTASEIRSNYSSFLKETQNLILKRYLTDLQVDIDKFNAKISDGNFGSYEEIWNTTEGKEWLNFEIIMGLGLRLGVVLESLPLTVLQRAEALQKSISALLPSEGEKWINFASNFLMPMFNVTTSVVITAQMTFPLVKNAIKAYQDKKAGKDANKNPSTSNQDKENGGDGSANNNTSGQGNTQKPTDKPGTSNDDDDISINSGSSNDSDDSNSSNSGNKTPSLSNELTTFKPPKPQQTVITATVQEKTQVMRKGDVYKDLTINLKNKEDLAAFTLEGWGIDDIVGLARKENALGKINHNKQSTIDSLKFFTSETEISNSQNGKPLSLGDFLKRDIEADLFIAYRAEVNKGLKAGIAPDLIRYNAASKVGRFMQELVYLAHDGKPVDLKVSYVNFVKNNFPGRVTVIEVAKKPTSLATILEENEGQIQTTQIKRENSFKKSELVKEKVEAAKPVIKPTVKVEEIVEQKPANKPSSIGNNNTSDGGNSSSNGNNTAGGSTSGNSNTSGTSGGTNNSTSGNGNTGSSTNKSPYEYVTIVNDATVKFRRVHSLVERVSLRETKNLQNLVNQLPKAPKLIYSSQPRTTKDDLGLNKTRAFREVVQLRLNTKTFNGTRASVPIDFGKTSSLTSSMVTNDQTSLFLFETLDNFQLAVSTFADPTPGTNLSGGKISDSVKNATKGISNSLMMLQSVAMVSVGLSALLGIAAAITQMISTFENIQIIPYEFKTREGVSLYWDGTRVTSQMWGLDNTINFNIKDLKMVTANVISGYTANEEGIYHNGKFYKDTQEVRNMYANNLLNSLKDINKLDEANWNIKIPNVVWKVDLEGFDNDLNYEDLDSLLKAVVSNEGQIASSFNKVYNLIDGKISGSATAVVDDVIKNIRANLRKSLIFKLPEINTNGKIQIGQFKLPAPYYSNGRTYEKPATTDVELYDAWRKNSAQYIVYGNSINRTWLDLEAGKNAAERDILYEYFNKINKTDIEDAYKAILTEHQTKINVEEKITTFNNLLKSKNFDEISQVSPNQKIVIYSFVDRRGKQRMFTNEDDAITALQKDGTTTLFKNDNVSQQVVYTFNNQSFASIEEIYQHLSKK